MKKPTVLIIGPTPPPYMGPSVATKMIIESSELREKFHIIHLDTADRRSLTNIGKVDFRNIFLAIIHLVNLVSLLIKFSPRLVYLPICQTIKGYLRDVAFMGISKILGARIVIHLRGGYFRELYRRSNIISKVIIKYSLKYVDRVIVLGKSLRYIFEELVPSERIWAVPNGIDRNYITDAEFMRAQKGRINGKKNPDSGPFPGEFLHQLSLMKESIPRHRILFLSNMVLSKGYYDVIRAIPYIVERIDDVIFIFAGEYWGSEREKKKVDCFIAEHNIAKHIIFCGRTVGSNKKNLLLQADVMVLPTYYMYEGQPWVVIEAMAAGLPIITTAQGCIRDMVVNRKNGFIVEKQNPRQIANRIITLFRDSGLRKRMAIRSRERFLKYYTKDRFITGLSYIFERATLHD